MYLSVYLSIFYPHKKQPPAPAALGYRVNPFFLFSDDEDTGEILVQGAVIYMYLSVYLSI